MGGRFVDSGYPSTQTILFVRRTKHEEFLTILGFGGNRFVDRLRPRSGVRSRSGVIRSLDDLAGEAHRGGLRQPRQEGRPHHGRPEGDQV